MMRAYKRHIGCGGAFEKADEILYQGSMCLKCSCFTLEMQMTVNSSKQNQKEPQVFKALDTRALTRGTRKFA